MLTCFEVLVHEEFARTGVMYCRRRGPGMKSQQCMCLRVSSEQMDNYRYPARTEAKLTSILHEFCVKIRHVGNQISNHSSYSIPAVGQRLTRSSNHGTDLYGLTLTGRAKSSR
ncbi:hypothetical protein RvY_00853-3 [Ramazzottius varieornatus]|uniref:Uncharacterized protein n=1 Tax=Ramazzottius varieornatus TaxID=947166 RepID=A0A1D1ULF0_RAMVA|nr:hypothetical protein RvY_00853-3 [Ramazzottius varieornatus]